MIKANNKYYTQVSIIKTLLNFSKQNLDLDVVGGLNRK